MLSDLLESDIKKVIDHFHIGRLQKYDFENFYCKVFTNQGLFILLEHTPTQWRTTIETEQIKQIPYQLKRVLLADYLGNLEEYSSYQHFQHCYYSLYQVI